MAGSNLKSLPGLLFSSRGRVRSLHPPLFTEAHEQPLLPRIAVAATVISVCRAMLSIRSLAATCHVDPAWLLNHAELSRVHWRRGTSEGEIVVEVNEMDVVLPCRSLPSTSVEMEYPPKV